jgi:hypothetical protein
MPVSSSSSGSEVTRSLGRGEWLVVVLAIAAAAPLWRSRGKVDRAGLVVDAPITLITSDRENLGCALPRWVGRYRCEFQSPKRPWPAPLPHGDLLAPYDTEQHATVQQQMFLIPGLFEQPSLAARYAKEPPEGVPRDRLVRFVAHCKLRLVERVDEFQARWSRDWPWGPQAGVWVAEPVSCSID